MSKERMYVIGDRGIGVLLIRTNPLRVVEISDEEISKYSRASATDGYAKVAASLWHLVRELRPSSKKDDAGAAKSGGIEALVTAGVQLTEVDFVFSSSRELGVVHFHQANEAPPQIHFHQAGEKPPQIHYHQANELPPPVMAQQASEAPPPPIRAQQASEAPPPPIRAQQASEAPPPPVSAQQANEAPPPQVHFHQANDAPPEIHHHQANEAPAQVYSANIEETITLHAKAFAPLEEALRKLVEADGDSLQSASLPDTRPE
jgi:hypothetical protein